MKSVIAAAKACGFTERFDPLPSLALGAQEVTPLELATAYGTLATLGLHVQPRIIQEVVARDGRKLEMRTPEVREAVPPAAAYLVDDVLRGVLTQVPPRRRVRWDSAGTPQEKPERPTTPATRGS
jgi:membrane peptidoglycan carboxypeptidase